MNDAELVDIAKNIKRQMIVLVALCESDEWLSSKFVENDDDMKHFHAIQNFVNSTSDFYLYDHAQELSSAFHGIQNLIDELIQFLFSE